METIETISLTKDTNIGITVYTAGLDDSDNPIDPEYGCPYIVTYKSSRYLLGNTHVKNHWTFLLEQVGTDYEKDTLEDAVRYEYTDVQSLKAFKRLEDRFDNDFIWMKVYGYIHGSVWLDTRPIPNAHFGFDSGQTGVICISKKEARKLWGWDVLTKARIDEVKTKMTSAINWFSEYLNNNAVEGHIQCAYCDEVLEHIEGYYLGFDVKKNGLLEEAEYYKENPLICAECKFLECASPECVEHPEEGCQGRFIITPEGVYFESSIRGKTLISWEDLTIRAVNWERGNHSKTVSLLGTSIVLSEADVNALVEELNFLV